MAGLALTVAMGWGLHREAVTLDRQRLALRVAEITGLLDARLEKSEMLLQHLRDYLMLSGESRNQVFARWCYENGLTVNSPWLYGIVVATNRNPAPWPSDLAKLTEAWTDQDRITAGEFVQRHPVECQIALTSELTNQLQFLADYDLKVSYLDESSGLNRHRLAHCIKEASVGMGPRRTVMLDANRNALTGTLFLVPVYHAGLSDFFAVEGRTRRDWGWARWLQVNSLIVAPVNFKALEKSIWEGLPADLGLEFFSSTKQTAETWLNISEGTPRAADPAFNAYLTHRQTWRMYGTDFSIFFHTTPLFEAQSPRRLAWITIAAGIVLTLLATALAGVARHAHDRQERMTEQIREARDALAAAQQEREKFSRDLHDGTIQSLYAIQLGLGHTVLKLDAEPAKAGRELSAVRGELDVVIAEIRRFITAEKRDDKPVNLRTVLEALAQRARRGTTTQIESHCDPDAVDRLTGDQSVQLANIAREALSNSLRHAKPQRVEMTLRREKDAVALEIHDNGVGFDPASPGQRGVGLTSMASRAREMGASLDIQSSPGQGSRILVRVPASSEEAAGSESRNNHKP